MNIIAALGGLTGIKALVETLVPNRTEKQKNQHDEIMARVEAFAKEFKVHPQRTWFDGLVDGLNRLPRPMIVFGIIGLFVYAFVDHIGYAIRMEALSLTPQWLTYAITGVIAFFFGSRSLLQSSDLKARSMTEVVQTLERIERLKAMREPGEEKVQQEAQRAETRAIQAMVEDEPDTLPTKEEVQARIADEDGPPLTTEELAVYNSPKWNKDQI